MVADITSISSVDHRQGALGSATGLAAEHRSGRPRLEVPGRTNTPVVVKHRGLFHRGGPEPQATFLTEDPMWSMRTHESVEQEWSVTLAVERLARFASADNTIIAIEM